MEDAAWRATLQEAVSNPAARFIVSLDGVDGASTYSKVMNAAQRGAGDPGRLFDWEMAPLYQGQRLRDVQFWAGGEFIANPF